MGKTIKSGYKSDGIKIRAIKKKTPRHNKHVNVDEFWDDSEDYSNLHALDSVENLYEEPYSDNH